MPISLEELGNTYIPPDKLLCAVDLPGAKVGKDFVGSEELTLDRLLSFLIHIKYDRYPEIIFIFSKKRSDIVETIIDAKLGVDEITLNLKDWIFTIVMALFFYNNYLESKSRRVGDQDR